MDTEQRARLLKEAGLPADFEGNVSDFLSKQKRSRRARWEERAVSDTGLNLKRQGQDTASFTPSPMMPQWPANTRTPDTAQQITIPAKHYSLEKKVELVRDIAAQYLHITPTDLMPEKIPQDYRSPHTSKRYVFWMILLDHSKATHMALAKLIGVSPTTIGNGIKTARMLLLHNQSLSNPHRLITTELTKIGL